MIYARGPRARSTRGRERISSYSEAPGNTNIYGGSAFKCYVQKKKMAPSSRNRTFVVIGVSTLMNLANESSVHRNYLLEYDD